MKQAHPRTKRGTRQRPAKKIPRAVSTVYRTGLSRFPYILEFAEQRPAPKKRLFRRRHCANPGPETPPTPPKSGIDRAYTLPRAAMVETPLILPPPSEFQS